jgi:hypothetical protein
MHFQNLCAPNFFDNVISPLLHPSQMCEFRQIFEGFIGSLHINVLYRTLVNRNKRVLNIFCCYSSIKFATRGFPFRYDICSLAQQIVMGIDQHLTCSTKPDFVRHS